MRGVAVAQGLNTDKATSLETETLLVIYSIESEEDFVGNITRELGVDATQAQMLAKGVSSQVFSVITDKANELAKGAGDTLQTTPDKPIETQEIAPRVVVEAPTAENKPTINLIPPPVVEKELELAPPKPGESLTSLAPANLPTTPIEKPKNFMDEKLKQVVTAPIRTSSYPGGVDPYREPMN